MATKPTNIAPCLSYAIIALGERKDGPKTTNEAVGTAFRRSATTGHRILAGDRDADAQEYANAVDSPIGEAVVAAIFGGSSRWVVSERATCVDSDGDGDIDKGDVLCGGIKAMQMLAEQLQAVQRHASGRSYTPTQQAEINAIVTGAMNALGRVITTVNMLTITGGRSD